MPSMSKKISTNFNRAILGEEFIQKSVQQGLGYVNSVLGVGGKKPGIDVNSVVPLQGRVFIGVLALSDLLSKNIEAQMDGATSDVPSGKEKATMMAKAFGFGIALVVSLAALIIPAISIGLTMGMLYIKNDESFEDKLSTKANESVANQVSKYRSDIISNAKKTIAKNTIAKKLGLEVNPADIMDEKLDKSTRKARTAQRVARHERSADRRAEMTGRHGLHPKPEPQPETKKSGKSGKESKRSSDRNKQPGGNKFW